MIKLIRGDGEAQYIEPSHIMVIQKTDEGAQIHFRDGKWMIVKESPEEVARKVLEWKLAMVDYRIFTERGATDGDYDIADDAMNRLYQLAGLEE